MKKKTIWTIAVIMGLSFLALLFLQLKYIEEMAEMKKEQFDESVNRALYQASRNLELNETLKYLEQDVTSTQHDGTEASTDEPDSMPNSNQTNTTAKSKNIYSSFDLKTLKNNPAQIPKAMIMRNNDNSLTATKKSMQEIVRN